MSLGELTRISWFGFILALFPMLQFTSQLSRVNVAATPRKCKGNKGKPCSGFYHPLLKTLMIFAIIVMDKCVVSMYIANFVSS